MCAVTTDLLVAFVNTRVNGALPENTHFVNEWNRVHKVNRFNYLLLPMSCSKDRSISKIYKNKLGDFYESIKKIFNFINEKQQIERDVSNTITFV